MMILPTPSSSRPYHLTLDDVLPGCFYVIDPSTIPPKYAHQFKQIRIVMVSERTESRISLRFPSTHSLRCHFSRISAPHTRSGGVRKNNLPPLDEKYVIGSEAACQLLLRRVSPEELAERKTALDFWVAWNTSSPVVVKTNNADGEGDAGGMSTSSLTVSKRGSCWSELRGTDMVSWGKRRRVRFLNRHEESLEDKSGQLLALTQGCEGMKDDDEDEEEDGEEVPENMDDENEVKSPVRAKTNWTQKRKHLARGDGASTSKKRSRRNPLQSRGKQVQVYARKAKLTAINRWSVERYKLAEENMLKIMKEKGAAFNHPIMRPALRTEARKLIGDTGLLDHLLKHMSGKLAPGGKERFRRRHNADGAMEYWLESADLVDLRRQAGVDDPFWTPPHGWMLGDNPSQDPTCAREIRELREEVATLKREIHQLATAIFDREGNQLVTVTTQTSCKSGLNLEQVAASIISLKEMCTELARKESAWDEQLWEMALSLNETKIAMEELKAMKEEMGKLNWAVGESNPSGSGESTLVQLMVTANDAGAGCEVDNIRHTKEDGRKKNRGTQTVDADAATDEMTVAMLRAQKAEKLQRLRSCFEICQPQTLTKSQLMAPAAVVEHLVAIPTPPAVSLFSVAAASPLSQSSPPGQQGQQPQTGSPFKAMAERLALTVRPPGNEYSAVAINVNE
ncbi:hypothetical protein MLD38_008934 [Melastoma candidum]|uniref:Uncharacterized protein n=1 Tax=Melastoma candidum TaxID=119954 RepID=A0ACB9RVK4_9MYRT|nr:hypothetical protein MLD38_008934 [Melastoma candidum]